MQFRRLPITLFGLALAPALFAQDMPAATFIVGDQWTYREIDLLTKIETGQWTETVTSVDAAEYWIDSQRKARTWWRGDAVKQLHREQFSYSEGAEKQLGKSIASNDGGCAYPWPLKVGTKFECTDTVAFPNGRISRYDLKFEVEGAEKVETAAGRFDPLRLVAAGFSTNLTNAQASATGYRHERVIWLAPAVKREVKHEIRTWVNQGAPFRVEGRELVAFKAGGG